MIALAVCALTLALRAGCADQTQLEKYGENKFKKYQLDVPGKKPITIIETASSEVPHEWVDISVNSGRGKDDMYMKNMMTDIIHDHDTAGDHPRCYGPSCQEGFVEDEGPQGEMDETIPELQEKSKDFRDFSSDRLQAITALAEKLKKQKLKVDKYYSQPPPVDQDEEEDNGKVYTTWNRLKVKQHKHPFDDKDGWVTLEPVAWSTSKISKWKPNVKKQKPVWTDNDDRFPSDSQYSMYQGIISSQGQAQKKPSMNRPVMQYINNKLHVTSDSNWESEIPSRPSWTKPESHYSYPSSWNPDDGRKPHKPNCDNEEQPSSDDTMYYGMSDPVVTDSRPSYFPYEYEALKRPIRRPTQVVYAGPPDVDSDRASRPPFADGQWVLLSTTKGYRNKKRQRSLSFTDENPQSDPQTITSHHTVGLTVLPVDNNYTNMTTSHGGLLEVEKSFQTVEESKRDMDRKNERPDEEPAASETRPGGHRVVRKKVYKGSMAPDGSAVLAAVGAGMVPATMAMVVPMMLGKRRRRDLHRIRREVPVDRMVFKFE
ncbi:hypothetical protein JYU34_013693 [Plutella xylostella]|uniref:Uncharacterized protein n=1 Tax=Plutella xylostella TaxID=51655 RepID=A0ABQ7QAG1_PLUXY|nr:hypothetical protein JYU34_013693 [Plutella xylostella]